MLLTSILIFSMFALYTPLTGKSLTRKRSFCRNTSSLLTCVLQERAAGIFLREHFDYKRQNRVGAGRSKVYFLTGTPLAGKTTMSIELIKLSQKGKVIADVGVPITLLSEISDYNRIACMLASPELVTCTNYGKRDDHKEFLQCILSNTFLKTSCLSVNCGAERPFFGRSDTYGFSFTYFSPAR